MLKTKCSRIALLAGLLAGLVIGGKLVERNSSTAFMGTKPDAAVRMDTVKWLDEDDPKFRPATMKPRPNIVELKPASIWFGPQNCRKFHLGPRYSKCLLKEQEVKPTELPYE